jgi:hypothetical protein
MSKDWETYQAGSTVRIRRRPVRYRATARATEPVAEADLSSLKKDELVAEAEKRGVDSSGTKAEIIERLES